MVFEHPYLDMFPRVYIPPARKINGNLVAARETCPVCRRQLVNLYGHGDEWKCKKCWEEVNDEKVQG